MTNAVIWLAGFETFGSRSVSLVYCFVKVLLHTLLSVIAFIKNFFKIQIKFWILKMAWVPIESNPEVSFV